MIHPEYKAVFALLAEHGIRHCALRDELEGGELVDDLDLLVESKAFDRAVELLGDAGYRLRRTDRLLPGKSVLLRPIANRFVAIDLHRTVVQNGIELVDGDAVLERMPGGEDAYLPAPADLLAILVLHNVVGKGRLQDKHYAQIESLAARVEPAAIREVLGDDRLAELVLAILEEPWRYRDTAAAGAARDCLVQRYRSRDRGLGLRLKALEFRRRLAYYRLRPRAPLYALTGVDGVGKSSLTDAILTRLGQPGGFRAATLYMGPWGHYLLKGMRGELFVPGWSVDSREWLNCLVGRGVEDRPPLGTAFRILAKTALGRELESEEETQYAAVRRTSRLFVTARFLRSIFAAARFAVMIMAEMYWRYWLVYRQRRRGVTVIADRYVYDLMTGRMHETIPQYRRLRAFLCAIFPKPTRVFLLYNDPETILARKADLGREVLARHLALYDELAEKHGFTRVKTDRPPEEIACDLVADCFNEIVAYDRV